MEAKAQVYVPQVFQSFQGFDVEDIKEYRSEARMEIILKRNESHVGVCMRCGSLMGNQHSRYWVKAKHLRVFGWAVELGFFREKRYCPSCRKIRSELIEFLSPVSPHMTLDLAWWINRLSEITSVQQVSRLESVDKMACYAVDKYILMRLLQGYEIPKVTHIGVDEVYARGPKQLKQGETRDDLFLTVIVDLRTRKVIWVSKSRRKEALDEFFEVLGKQRCEDIEVVATDQHEGYTASVKQYCPDAVVVLDRFHLVKNFNDALNEDRREELENIDPEGEMGDLMNGKYRYIFLTKAGKRSQRGQKHIAHVTRLNKKMAQLEIIKEHFHRMFDAPSVVDAKVMLAEIYQWSLDCKAENVFKWVLNILKDERFWNYFEHRYSSGVVEGINRVIKGLKWQAYGYRDMDYFKLKILQRCGYLNSHFALKQTYT